MNNFDEINYFCMNNNQNKIGIFVKFIWKVLMGWKNGSDFKGQDSMNFREENWSKIKTLFMNSRPEFRNYRMKFIVWMIREILKMLNPYAVDYLTLPVNLCYSHVFEILAECWAVLWECRAATISRQTFGTRMENQETFLLFQQRLLHHFIFLDKRFNLWISDVKNVYHRMQRVSAKHQTALDPRCQSRPSARNSFDFGEGRFSKDYGASQQRLQISDLHFDKFFYPTEDKIQDWSMYLLFISYGSHALDQRSGDGWFNGWFKIFVINKRNSNAKSWSIRCEDCFSTEQNHS